MNHSEKIITKYDGIITNYDGLVYYKVRWTVITNCDSFFYYKVLHGLQIVTGITKCDGFTTNCDMYYKVRLLLKIATIQASIAIEIGNQRMQEECIAYPPEVRTPVGRTLGKGEGLT